MLVIPAAVLTFALAVERTAAAFTVARREQREQSMLAKALDLADLERMDLDKNGKVTREEFMLFMLVLPQPSIRSP